MSSSSARPLDPVGGVRVPALAQARARQLVGYRPPMPTASYGLDGDVAEIVIDAGPLNLFTPDLFGDLDAAVARAAAERPRALIVRADGDVFSAGVDVHVFEGLDTDGATALTERLLALTHAVEDL